MGAYKECMVGVGGIATKVEERYKKLATEREDFLSRAREYSKLTLPYILPETETRQGAANQHGYTSAGAKAVNHLSNKLVMTLFPPQKDYFKLAFSSEAKEGLEEEGYDVQEMSQLLVKATEAANEYQDSISLRSALIEVEKNLIISGNCLLLLPPDKKPAKAIPLDRYVQRLCSDFTLMELIIEKKKEFGALSSEIRDLLKAAKLKDYTAEEKTTLYTYVVKRDDVYHIFETCDNVVISAPQTVKEEKNLPWLSLRWNQHYEEDYGRGRVEDTAGDLFAIEFLSSALAKGMVLMADVKYFLKNGSTIDIDHFVTSETGEVIRGNIEDIGVLQLERFADFTSIKAVLDDYKREVGQSYLQNSAIRRDAERVTAYELSLDAQEIETSLGGVYTSQANSLQKPLAYRGLAGAGVKEVILKGVEPEIATGLEALGRSGDMDKIVQFSELMSIPNGWSPEVQKRVKWGVYSLKVANSLSMELDFLMTDDEYAEVQQQQQEQAMMENAAGEASKAIPKMIEGGQNG